jgi:hypothetical protein
MYEAADVVHKVLIWCRFGGIDLAEQLAALIWVHFRRATQVDIVFG